MLPAASREADHLQRKRVTGQQVEQAIAELEAACQAANVNCRLHRETGDPFSAMIDLARYHDIVVFGLRSVFEHDLLCPDPEAQILGLVMAGVRPVIAVSREFRHVSRVLIAYSGTMESAKAMKRFVQLRLWPDAHLRIVTFNPSDSNADKLVHDAADYCRAHGFQVEWQTNPGDPKVLLFAAAALWQADMIVMGNSARSVFLRRALGDTALEAIRRAEIPLFLCQ
jgi:nucleotide-binding universal stress UspA family protein